MLFEIVLITLLLEYSCSSSNTPTCSITFPDNFTFNAATAAYQIEGGWNEDGKGLSVWDTFALENPDAPNGDVACDSYHKYKEDVALMKFLGVNQYKFSIAWTRILPNGFNTSINQKGIDYYKNLIKELKQNGIEPFPIIFHNDLPQVLQDLGGPTNRSFADWFADYSRLVFTIFGDDVKHWGSINEGEVLCLVGYGLAKMAPFVTGQQYLCGHNVLRAHAKAWHIYESEFKPTQKGEVVMTFATNWYYPATNKTEDIEAAERAMQFTTGWFSNPIYHGDYPEIMKERIAYRSQLEGLSQSRLPEFTEEEKKLIKGTGSYFPVQVYDAFAVTDVEEASADSPLSFNTDMKANTTQIFDYVRGAFGMGDLLQWIVTHCDNPTIFVSENGFADDTYDLEDDHKIDVLKAFLIKIKEAMNNGINITGYTVWALMDNYNWAAGYETKFGLVQVDFNSPNRTRTPRKSAYFFKNLTETLCF